MFRMEQGVVMQMQKRFALPRKGLLVSLGMMFIVVIGFRASTIGTDTHNYQNYYALVAQHILDDAQKMDFLFHHLVVIFSTLQLPSSVFFSAVALINFLFILLLVKTLVKTFEDSYRLDSQTNYPFSESVQETSLSLDAARGSILFYDRTFLLLMTFLMASPLFFSAMTNVIRQGVATFSLLILSLQIVSSRVSIRQLLSFGFLACLSVGFHQSSVVLLVFFPLLRLAIRRVYVLFGLLFSSYVTGLSMKGIHWLSMFSKVPIYDSIVNAYPDAHYHTGIRYDFALFTLLMGMFFYCLSQRYLSKAADKVLFITFLRPYWVLTFPFFMVGFGAYSDRLLLAPWLYLSILATLFFSRWLCQHQYSKRWDMLMFLISACYFYLKLQPDANKLLGGMSL